MTRPEQSGAVRTSGWYASQRRGVETHTSSLHVTSGQSFDFRMTRDVSSTSRLSKNMKAEGHHGEELRPFHLELVLQCSPLMSFKSEPKVYIDRSWAAARRFGSKERGAGGCSRPIPSLLIPEHAQLMAFFIELVAPQARLTLDAASALKVIPHVSLGR
eukprot:TRINITY_DN5740_c0_g2_i2.p1 TRINITY_DN5740_c0_g2~~TRINITY_DN5740_c0_g2_i2.p1  ORF type:complete len:159 (-),score=12.32 TRINITY_DN5740_c0_g2_i2:690-1166(-)